MIERISQGVLSPVLVLGLLVLAPAEPLAAADPFYESLATRGARELARGNPAEAARLLRLACFGMLEEPVELAGCLVDLAESQAAAGDEQALRQTLDRVLEIEDRFATLDRLPQDDQETFAELASDRLPAAVLRAYPGLATLVPEAPAPVIRMPPKQARRALERALRANPGNTEAMYRLAVLERGRGKRGRAIELLERLLAAEPEHGPGRCLRADLGIEERSCQPAVATFATCTELGRRTEDRIFLLECLAGAERWNEADHLWTRLTSVERQLPRAARVHQELEAHSPRQAAAQPGPGTEPEAEPANGDPAPGTEGPVDAAAPNASADAETIQPGPDPTGGAATEAPADPDDAPRDLPSDLDGRLAAIREALENATTPADLADPGSEVSRLADAYPRATEAQLLAGEAAYLGADWGSAAAYFRRAGELPTDRPLLLFYIAVSLYESGDREAAEPVLQLALPHLSRNSFVDRYIGRILGGTELE